MNDDNADFSSEFKSTLTYHSYSELVLYPWGHCTGCESPDHEQLIYHGDELAEMTQYENMQSSDLYPTSGDFCDWHYGVHGSYCYTMEIGTAFHQNENDIDHIAVRNLGVAFYMTEIADNPRERADLAISDITNQSLQTPNEVNIPAKGEIPIDMCIDKSFPYSIDSSDSHLMWRTVQPSRLQSDYGPREWSTTKWTGTAFKLIEDENCLIGGSKNGTILRATLDISETTTGQLHYKVMLGTLSGGDLYQYPEKGTYYTLDLSYREAYGSVFGSLFLFMVVAGFVWGGLAVCLRMMLSDDEELINLADAVLEEEAKTEG
jgi:hypothetical protein